LLVAITLHKLYDKVEANSAQKRSVHREQDRASEGWSALAFQVIAREPSPVEAVALTDQLALLMRRLDPVQRRILELRLQGHNLYEIAASAACSQRTVRRVLERVKQQLEKWHLELDEA
jgi:RNA polymerase sigma factor (sigma-70 family)